MRAAPIATLAIALVGCVGCGAPAGRPDATASPRPTACSRAAEVLAGAQAAFDRGRLARAERAAGEALATCPKLDGAIALRAEARALLGREPAPRELAQRRPAWAAALDEAGRDPNALFAAASAAASDAPLASALRDRAVDELERRAGPDGRARLSWFAGPTRAFAWSRDGRGWALAVGADLAVATSADGAPLPFPAPPGARELRTRPTAPVDALVFSRDGRRLVAVHAELASCDVLDVATGALITTIREPDRPSAMRRVALVGDRLFALSPFDGGDGVLAIFDATSGARLARSAATTITSMAVHEDGRNVAVGHAGGDIAIASLSADGSFVESLVGTAREPVLDLALRTNGDVVVAGFDETELWDTRARRLIRTVRARAASETVRVAPNGAYVVRSGLWDHYVEDLRDATIGTQRDLPRPRGGGVAWQLVGDDRIAFESDGVSWLADLATGRATRVPGEAPIASALALHPDLGELVGVDTSGRAHVLSTRGAADTGIGDIDALTFDGIALGRGNFTAVGIFWNELRDITDTFHVSATQAPRKVDAVFPVATSRDATRLVFWKDGIHVHELGSARPRARTLVATRPERPEHLALSARGERLVSMHPSDVGYVMLVWNLASGKVELARDAAYDFGALALSEDGTFGAAREDDRIVVGKLPLDDPRSIAGTLFAWGDGTALAVVDDRTITVRDAARTDVEPRMVGTAPSAIDQIVMALDAPVIATCQGGRVAVWDAAGGGSFELELAEAGPCEWLALAPDGALLAVVLEGGVRFIRLETATEVGRYALAPPGPTGIFTASDGRVELLGARPPAARCVAGRVVVPFEACEARIVEPGLSARLLAGPAPNGP